MVSNSSGELPSQGPNGTNLPTNNQPAEEDYEDILDFEQLEPMQEKAKSNRLSDAERQAALDELQAKWDSMREAA